MRFRDAMLGQARPSSVRAVDWPRRQQFFPSPADWRGEVIYFLLPDRFSDAQENGRAPLNRSSLASARPAGFRFDLWAQSGGDRYQGGTIAGVTSKLDYLKTLGITTQAATPGFTGPHPVGQKLPVKFRNGTAFVEIRNLGPSEVLLVANRP
jgi:hypothetical protein